MAEPTQPGYVELAAAMDELRARLAKLEQAVQQQAAARVVPPPLPPATAKPALAATHWANEQAEDSLRSLAQTYKPPGPARPAEPAKQAGQPPLTASGAAPSPPAAGANPPPPVATQATPAGPAAKSLEQLIGTRWMLIAGVVVLLLAGVFLFKFVYDLGWITPMRRLISGIVLGLIVIGTGEWAIRRRMRMFGAALVGVGIVWLYQVVYVASPSGIIEELHAIDHPAAFALMCAVTLLGIGLSLQTRMILAAIISLVGALATPILLSTGQNQETLLMCYLLVVDAGFLAVALARQWSPLGVLSLAGTAIVFGAWLYKHYTTDAMAATAAFAWSLAAVHGAYVVAALRTKRAGLPLTNALTAMTSVLLALALLFIDEASCLHGFCIQMLLVGAAVLAYAMWQRQAVLAAVLLAVLHALLWAGLLKVWGLRDADGLTDVRYAFYAWGFIGLIASAGVLKRLRQPVAHLISICIASFVMVLGWLAVGQQSLNPWLAGQLVALVTLVLAVGQWQRWRGANFAMLFCSALFIAATTAGHFELGAAATASLWIWPLYAILIADVLIRTWGAGDEAAEPLDAVLTTLATTMMFAGTYALLHQMQQRWTWASAAEAPPVAPILAAIEHMPLGIYAFSLAAGLIVLAVIVRRLAGRRTLAYAFLAQGMVLATVAVPIHFDRSAITIAWTAQAVVAMVVAKRLGNRMLLAVSPIVLMLAMCHFLGQEIPNDRALGDVLWSPLGVAIDYGLVLSLVLAAGSLLTAGVLRIGRPITRDGDKPLAGMLVTAGVAVFAVMTAWKLPAIAVSWWWLGLIALLGVWAVVRRSGPIAAAASLMLAATLAKYVSFDTFPRAGGLLWMDWPVVLNWQFGLGVALAAGVLLWRRLCIARSLVAWPGFATTASLTAALPVLWAGSIEIHRFFYGPAAPAWTDAYQGMHMGLSLWWGLYAAVLLALGFTFRRPALRYLAITMFAIVIVKVFLVDLAHIQMVYRVLSLMGLGVLLLCGSLLYHRQLKEVVGRRS